MIERLIFTPEAEEDIAEAYNWYEGHEPGLGEEFLRCVEALTLTIQRHPHIFPVAVDEFRRGPIRRFPYEIFYEPTHDSITIYSVFHCSQDPKRWHKRPGFGDEDKRANRTLTRARLHVGSRLRVEVVGDEMEMVSVTNPDKRQSPGPAGEGKRARFAQFLHRNDLSPRKLQLFRGHSENHDTIGLKNPLGSRQRLIPVAPDRQGQAAVL